MEAVDVNDKSELRDTKKINVWREVQVVKFNVIISENNVWILQKRKWKHMFIGKLKAIILETKKQIRRKEM